jgi:hypothetical protein
MRHRTSEAKARTRTRTNLLALVTTELEVLAALQSVLETVLALDALETEHNLLGGLGLLIQCTTE